LPTSLHTKAGLPDFSWYGIPKREKYTKITTKYTKWQSNIPNGHKTYQHLFLQDTPKNCPYWDFWFEKKQSGNPALMAPKNFHFFQESLHNVKQAF
jgi:hypothetical protein